MGRWWGVCYCRVVVPGRFVLLHELFLGCTEFAIGLVAWMSVRWAYPFSIVLVWRWTFLAGMIWSKSLVLPVEEYFLIYPRRSRSCSTLVNFIVDMAGYCHASTKSCRAKKKKHGIYPIMVSNKTVNYALSSMHPLNIWVSPLMTTCFKQWRHQIWSLECSFVFGKDLTRCQPI